MVYHACWPATVEKRKKSRLERGRGMGGERQETRARARSDREKRVGDNESVRASLAKRSERSRSRHFWPVRLQVAGRALSWRSVRLSEASKKKGGLFYMCVSIVCVYIDARSSELKKRSTTCQEFFDHITLNTKGWFWSDWFEDKKREK